MSALSDIIERVRSVIFRRRDERELAEELAFHADMEAAQLERRGVSRAEARRRSALALGGLERVKDDVRDARGTRFLHDGQRDVAFALRTLARNPGFAAVAILTLAVGNRRHHRGVQRGGRGTAPAAAVPAARAAR
jgi:hypothetical protein